MLSWVIVWAYWTLVQHDPSTRDFPAARALIYSFFVKYYVAGLTAGAVKG